MSKDEAACVPQQAAIHPQVGVRLGGGVVAETCSASSPVDSTATCHDEIRRLQAAISAMSTDISLLADAFASALAELAAVPARPASGEDRCDIDHVSAGDTPRHLHLGASGDMDHDREALTHFASTWHDATTLRRSLDHITQENRALTSALAESRLHRALVESRLAEIEHSTAWQASGPWRRFGSRHRRFARIVRRIYCLARSAGQGELRARLLAWWVSRHGLPQTCGTPLQGLHDILSELRLPASLKPDISVIIPSFGRVPVTARCLASIQRSATMCELEVIVADDASGDPDLDRLDSVPGLQLIRNEANIGFLRNCNAAAQAARGRHLLFLNNDTEIRPKAIDALLILIESRNDAGAIGAKLIYSDGRLQEAGGIIWNDASGWNYGHGGDPRASEFNYVRDVDYCSGAALLVPRTLFRELGGFDERYSPAYCEDSDLAFRIRARGLKVLYQPKAEVIHHEGLSHGTDLARGVKSYQVRNQRILREIWAAELQRDQYPPGTDILRARDRARGKPVCLVVDHYVPEPDRDAGSRTMFGFIETMSEAGWIIKFWPDNQASRQPYTDALQQAGVEVMAGPRSGGFGHWIAANGASLDHVLLSRPGVSLNYLAGLRRHAPQAVVSFYGHDLHAMRMRREAALSNDPAWRSRADAMERIERLIWRQVDMVLYPSEVEVAIVHDLEPGTLVRAVTPYRYPDPQPRLAVPPGHALLFVAGFSHPPNRDAAAWLVRDVLPLVRAEVPDVRLALIGSHPTPDVLALSRPDVEIAGFVPETELRRRYATARVAVVPLRVGAGVKAKVAEALQAGLPLVTTTIGAEGMTGLDQVVSVANDSTEIASSIVELLRDDAAWLAASNAQTAYAAAHFGAARMRESLLQAFAAAAEVRQARVARDAGALIGPRNTLAPP
jgi:GT2 family glycosyltransferase